MNMETRKFTKINGEQVLIDTYNVDYDDYLEDFKAYCEDNGFEIRGNEKNMEGLYFGGKITFYEWVNRNIGEDAEEFWAGLERVNKSPYIDYYVVTGTLGLWNCRPQVYDTFESLYEACSKCATDAYDIIVKCDGQKIDFTSMHHDGTNTFEIRRISWEDKEKIDWWDDEKDGNMIDFISEHARPISWEMLGM